MFKLNKAKESGRSMVEMLGVLAIIGVLSVGGIAGYIMAMRKHKANELANIVSMTIIAAKTKGDWVGYTDAYKTSISSELAPITEVWVAPESSRLVVYFDGDPAPSDTSCPFCKTYKDSVGSTIGGESVTFGYGALE